MESRGKTLWWYFHNYRRLADEGKAKPLSCPDDGTEYVLTLNRKKEDLPNLWCPYCNSTSSPGLDLVAQVQAVVGEWEL